MYVSDDINVIKDKITKNTLILSRDVVQHMNNDDIGAFLDNIKQFDGSYFICSNYINNDPCVNLYDIVTSGVNNRNLFIPPFNLPLTKTYPENKYRDNNVLNKHMSIWKIEDGLKTM